jgi:protocatechuate 3,4-dioxygenase beta subunit
MKRVALATVLLSAIALTAEAQPPRENPSASIPQTRTFSGRVVADETGDPIANARVSVSATGPGAPVVLTDRQGRFTLTAPPSRVTVVANKTGYGRHEATLAAADRSIEIRLQRCAAISGRVVDELGDPIMGARVVVEKPSSPSNGFSGEAATSTDDRGEYRLGSLQAGTFNIAVVTMGAMTRREIGPDQYEWRRPRKPTIPA